MAKKKEPRSGAELSQVARVQIRAVQALKKLGFTVSRKDTVITLTKDFKNVDENEYFKFPI